MSQEQIIELQNIHKSFVTRQGRRGGRRAVRAVGGVSLQIVAGENLGLVGESGSGKTTLGRVMVRLYRPDRGAVLMDGMDIAQRGSAKARRLQQRVQMVFQDPYSSLDPRFTVRRILLEALRQRGPRLSLPAEEERLLGILQQVGLPEAAVNRYPHEFSGGERQRVAIARALLMNPRLLILDEAVSALDVLIQDQIIRLLKDLQQAYPMTYLFISHNLRVVRKLCQRVAVMYQGRIVELADTAELFANPLHPYTRALLAAAVDYRAAPGSGVFDLPGNSCLIDKGNRHFVID